MRADDGNGAARVANGREAVALTVSARELTAVAAEGDEDASAVVDAQFGPVVAIEERCRRPAVEAARVTVSEVEDESLTSV